MAKILTMPVREDTGVLALDRGKLLKMKALPILTVADTIKAQLEYYAESMPVWAGLPLCEVTDDGA